MRIAYQLDAAALDLAAGKNTPDVSWLTVIGVVPDLWKGWAWWATPPL